METHEPPVYLSSIRQVIYRGENGFLASIKTLRGGNAGQSGELIIEGQVFCAVMLPSYRRTYSAIFSRIGRWRKPLMPPRKPSSRPACCLCSVLGSSRRSRLGPWCRTRPW